MSVAISTAARRGTTLLELIICVAIIGFTALIATLTIRIAAAPDPKDPATVIADSLERVLATGAPATLELYVNGRPALATINPDGGVIADSVLLFDRLTGRPSP